MLTSCTDSVCFEIVIRLTCDKEYVGLFTRVSIVKFDVSFMVSGLYKVTVKDPSDRESVL